MSYDRNDFRTLKNYSEVTDAAFRGERHREVTSRLRGVMYVVRDEGQRASRVSSVCASKLRDLEQ